MQVYPIPQCSKLLISKLFALSVTVLCVLLLLSTEVEDKRTALKSQRKASDPHQVSGRLTGLVYLESTGGQFGSAWFRHISSDTSPNP